MEQKLPFSPYDIEWDKAGRGKDPKLYLPFTHIEMLIPWVFLVIHAVVFMKSTNVLEFLKELT
jgi:hypothetical protein